MTFWTHSCGFAFFILVIEKKDMRHVPKHAAMSSFVHLMPCYLPPANISDWQAMCWFSFRYLLYLNVVGRSFLSKTTSCGDSTWLARNAYDWSVVPLWFNLIGQFFDSVWMWLVDYGLIRFDWLVVLLWFSTDWLTDVCSVVFYRWYFFRIYKKYNEEYILISDGRI